MAVKAIWPFKNDIESGGLPAVSSRSRDHLPFVLGSEREVFQIFNYYVYDTPRLNIVDLMNHLAFGGPPHKKLQNQMVNHISEIQEALAPIRKQRTKDRK